MDCFLKFCYEAELYEPTLPTIHPCHSNFLLGCFAINLIRGDNILGLNLKSSTIQGYVSAAASLFTDRKQHDPFKLKTLRINYPAIIIKALSKYEKQEKRKEVVTDSMFEHIDELAEADHVDGLHCAFKDWAAWSRYSGPRRSEWCQESQTYQRADAGEDDEAKAIIAADIHFFDKHGREITLDCDFSRVAYAEVEWRFQKNGMNGEKIKYYVNLLSQKWCPAYALWLIMH